ncbi:Transmembrane protein 68 [Terramyces sp. JEL0728]|nr:Transmembrane protein 68 [Terramyces sp. JEL0728]
MDIIQIVLQTVILLNLSVLILGLGVLHGIFRVLGLMDFSNPLKYTKFPLWFERTCTAIVLKIFPSEAHWRGRKPKAGEKTLFILNHQVTGIDSAVVFAYIYATTGIWPRALGDRCHFLIPIWGHILHLFGAFLGDRALCEQVMSTGSPLVIFPGGGDEVLRKKSVPKYSLQWKQRKGFAQLALKYGYTIVPVSAVGFDDMFYHWLDVRVGYFAYLVGDKRTDFTCPILIPNFQFQKIYVSFGQPVETQQDQAHWQKLEIVEKVRDQTKLAVEDGIQYGLNKRKSDPNRFVFKFLKPKSE